MVKFNENEISLRCLVCRSSSITLSLVSVLNETVPDLNSKRCYELSSRGPLVEYLKKTCAAVSCSEYFEQIDPGAYINGVQCQNVQCLTYSDEAFDICTSTEVFEHVPNDAKGFSEIYRVLKPGGVFVFTVPLSNQSLTVERATVNEAGDVKYLLPPAYHLDPIRGHNQILVYRDYGSDIVERLHSAGFDHAEIRPVQATPWPYETPVIVARREV